LASNSPEPIVVHGVIGLSRCLSVLILSGGMHEGKPVCVFHAMVS
jgi:hypothetical protein